MRLPGPKNPENWQNLHRVAKLGLAKDGGAHVDEKLTQQYESLKQLGDTWTAVEWQLEQEHDTVQFSNLLAPLSHALEAPRSQC
jgi:hypothetical protein